MTEGFLRLTNEDRILSINFTAGNLPQNRTSKIVQQLILLLKTAENTLMLDVLMHAKRRGPGTRNCLKPAHRQIN